MKVNPDAPAERQGTRKRTIDCLRRASSYLVTWLVAFAIAIELAILILFLQMAVGRWPLDMILSFSMGYAAGYPIYRGMRLLYREVRLLYPGLQHTFRSRYPRCFRAATWSVAQDAMARHVWRVSIVATLVLIPLYANPSRLARPAKAQRDTRAIADAISKYAAHCGGLPAQSSRTDCPIATAEPGGPHVLPASLLMRQTNRRGQIGGPFMPSLPALPKYWSGAGGSYAYYILPNGSVLICGQGDYMAVNSDGNSSCP